MSNADSVAPKGPGDRPVHRMEIVAVRIPFGDLVTFLVKLVLAAIPAVFIAAVIVAVIVGVLTMLGLVATR
jgi:hypothetical protein